MKVITVSTGRRDSTAVSVLSIAAVLFLFHGVVAERQASEAAIQAGVLYCISSLHVNLFSYSWHGKFCNIQYRCGGQVGTD